MWLGLRVPAAPARRRARTVKGPRPPALPRLRTGGDRRLPELGAQERAPPQPAQYFRDGPGPYLPPGTQQLPTPHPRDTLAAGWGRVSQVSLVAGGGLGAGRWAPRLPAVPTPRLGLTIGALSNLDLKLQPTPGGGCPRCPPQDGGAGGSGRGWTGARQPTWGFQRPPPWAPECPFSGLSLTAATSRPLSPLGSGVEALSAPFLRRARARPGVLLKLLHPQGQRFDPPTFRKMAAAAAASSGAPSGAPGITVPASAHLGAGLTRRVWQAWGDRCPSSSSGNTMQYRLPFSTGPLPAGEGPPRSLGPAA